ncbi:MAG: hypothetical protein WD231_00065 [Candidatus Woykebacteria bacterium]
MSVFYDHLVGLDDLHSDLAQYNLSFKEHYVLLNQIDSALHHEVLNVILLVLPVEHHEHFLVQFNSRPADQALLSFLRSFDPQIDGKIKETAERKKAKIKEDLKKVKK